MATTLSSSGIQQLSWTYTKTVTGFQAVQQGPDSLSGLFGFADANVIFTDTRTLAANGTYTYDLTNLTDFFNDTVVFGTVLGIMIQVSDGTIFAFGAATNAFEWFLSAPSERLHIQTGATLMFANDTLANGGTVDSGHKNILIEEISGVDPATYKIIIIGKLD
tara:strand:- start:4951 stop:5439 length:489 start_codon:yes stop_codon:yes gene_type:complete